MTTQDIIQQQDHRQYRNDIDALFSFTSGALAELLAGMQMKGMVVPRAAFKPFYEGFCNLYLQTAKSKHMQGEQELIDRIDKWMDPKNKITPQRVMDGRDLLKEWGRALEKCGVHTLGK